MKKTKHYFLLFCFLLLTAGKAYARTNIPLVKDTPGGNINDDRARDAVPPPSAYLEGNTIFISLTYSFPITAAITGENKECLFKTDFSASNEFTINLEENSIRDGDYALNIYYHYNWWRGEFSIGAKKPTPTADGSIVRHGYLLYRVEGTKATVTGLSKNIYGHTPSDAYANPDTIVIPSQFTYWDVTYDVTGIENKAFKGCTFTSVELPNTIEFIGNSAFAFCKNLKSINLPEGVTDIGGQAFEQCSALSSVTIPEGITTIEFGTFYWCSSLTSVAFPSTLKSIKEKAFRFCYSLPSIAFPEGVTEIASYAFENCLGLKSVELPGSLRTIQARCFFQCLLLTSIVIPEGVEEIMPQAFNYCVRLSSISLPESLTRISKKAFERIANPVHIYCHAQEPCEIAANTFSNYYGILHGPQGFKEKYQNDALWGNFSAIVEDVREEALNDRTDVSPAVLSEADESFFDLTGRPADGTQKGIYIKNGKKVLVR
ncbi:MAG: leucine-rich repeat domain-containing protein [Bacteroidaceae bacterium]|nr:leucine-rich repeat domain-containing protein [Bacteroidaceae bacterium]